MKIAEILHESGALLQTCEQNPSFLFHGMEMIIEAFKQRGRDSPLEVDAQPLADLPPSGPLVSMIRVIRWMVLVQSTVSTNVWLKAGNYALGIRSPPD